MSVLNKILAKLDGSKTLICSVIFIILNDTAINGSMSPDLLQILNIIIGVLGGGSVVHHVKKKFAVPK